MIKKLHILWKFSRPHTIIGSVVSIITLWLMALQNVPISSQVFVLILTLIAGISCNIFIVGLNQIIDIDLDKINKPKLPLADGSLSLSDAKKIIFTSLFIALITAFCAGIILGLLIVIICLIGVAYSVPPVQLKRHHLPAAMAITVVRGVLVNLGMFLHFSYAAGQMGWQAILFNTYQVMPSEIWVLTGFVVAFSIAIAWFKDMPDTVGDAKFRFKTLAIVYSPAAVLTGGVTLVSIAYIFAIYWSYSSGIIFLFICHLTAYLLFLLNVWFVRLDHPESVTRFYRLFWLFFFAEYIFFGIRALLE